jgi:hypothetical protein
MDADVFENAEPEIQRIVALTQSCPERFQDKCFELLLGAYITSVSAPPPPPAPHVRNPEPPGTSANGAQPLALPEVIRTRFLNLTKRLRVSDTKAADLFDFSLDPFTYHALDIPGTSKGERMRNVALFLAVKAYLSTGAWTADWKEFRADCINHDCWDPNNATKNMNHEWFKVASSTANVTLSPAGTKAAEALFARTAGGEESAA